MAEPSRENTYSAIPSGLSGPAVHVLARFTNSHRKASLPRLTHTVASQKQMEGTQITRKSDSYSQVIAPPPTMVAGGRQCASRSTITPNKTCSVDLYRRIKRRVGHSFKRAHCKRYLVPSKKQVAYKLSGTKTVFLALKEFHDLCSDKIVLVATDNITVMSYIGRRHEVGPTLCPAMENPDLVYQKTSNSQSLTHSRPAEHGSRQAIQAWPDHPDRMVPPSRGISNET